MKKGDSVPVLFKNIGGAEIVMLCKVWSVRVNEFEIEETNTAGKHLRFGFGSRSICRNSDTSSGSICVIGNHRGGKNAVAR